MTDSRFPPVTLFDTHARTLTSTCVGVEYELSILLPPDYATEEKSYPVVYLLDGSVLFGFAAGASLILLGEFVPALIVVGIGVHLNSYWDNQTHRSRDYDAIPDPINHPETPGGAVQFLEFIETELFPFIEANYRADPADRTLFGQSLAGHFVLYALAKRPGLFQRLIAHAPAMSPPFQALFHASMDPLGGRPPLPVKLAILASELDPIRPINEAFWSVLQERNYPGVDLHTFVLPDETHNSGIAAGYVKGLKAVFSEHRTAARAS